MKPALGAEPETGSAQGEMPVIVTTEGWEEGRTLGDLRWEGVGWSITHTLQAGKTAWKLWESDLPGM